MYGYGNGMQKGHKALLDGSISELRQGEPCIVSWLKTWQGLFILRNGNLKAWLGNRYRLISVSSLSLHNILCNLKTKLAALCAVNKERY